MKHMSFIFFVIVYLYLISYDDILFSIPRLLGFSVIFPYLSILIVFFSELKYRPSIKNSPRKSVHWLNYSNILSSSECLFIFLRLFTCYIYQYIESICLKDILILTRTIIF